MNIIVEKKYSITNNQYLINLNSKKTKSIDCLNIICDTLQIDKFKTIEEYFYFLSLINCEKDHSLFLSNKNKKDYMIYLKNKIKSIQKYNTDYFDKIYPVRKNLLSKIKLLKGCEYPIYSHNSATGRSKIISGTNFMTMKKEDRKNLSFDNFQVFEIDFNSCEPYFYLLSNNKITDDTSDIYQYIKDRLNISNNNRKELKNAIISIMYGAQYNTVKKISNIKKEEYQKLVDYLDIESFNKKINADYDNKKFILNYYNRPVIIKNNRSVLNYWVQSSVADFCYLAFNDFIEKNNINFHAIIHDAIICSSLEKDVYKFKNISALTCPVSNFKIPVSFHLF